MPNEPQVVERYRTVKTAGGVYLREDRGLIEITGRDRVSWLNGLVTNVVTTLRPGEGSYAFACNVRGRVIFDLNILVLEDRIWLDVDRRRTAAALAHLDHYLITEEVCVADRTAATRRLAIIGLQAPRVIERLGLGDLTAMAALRHGLGAIGCVPLRLFRQDIGGLPTAELILGDVGGATAPGTTTPRDAVPGLDAACGAIVSACTALEFVELDRAVVEILRIEAGIPASVDDIDEEILPPETGQTERGISHQKGCYLGQEVIERMRSRGALARRLVGLVVEGDNPVPPGSIVAVEGRDVGRTRSCCRSEAAAAVLALAYLKTTHADPGTAATIAAPEGPHQAVVVPLPVCPTK